MDAKNIRKIQDEMTTRMYNKVIDTHMSRIKSLIKYNIRQKECIYTVSNYIVGLPLYNQDTVLKHVGKKLKQEGYDVKRISKINLKISWTLTNKKSLKTYVKLLLGSVYELIKRALVQYKKYIEYYIPTNTRYKREHVQHYLKTILKHKKFGVEDLQNGKLKISW